MTGWIDGKYSKYHCDQISADTGQRCNKPARLRKFRDNNVAMCDDCFAFIALAEPAQEKQ